MLGAADYRNVGLPFVAWHMLVSYASSCRTSRLRLQCLHERLEHHGPDIVQGEAHRQRSTQHRSATQFLIAVSAF